MTYNFEDKLLLIVLSGSALQINQFSIQKNIIHYKTQNIFLTLSCLTNKKSVIQLVCLDEFLNESVDRSFLKKNHCWIKQT